MAYTLSIYKNTQDWQITRLSPVVSVISHDILISSDEDKLIVITELTLNKLLRYQNMISIVNQIYQTLNSSVKYFILSREILYLIKKLYGFTYEINDAFELFDIFNNQNILLPSKEICNVHVTHDGIRKNLLLLDIIYPSQFIIHNKPLNNQQHNKPLNDQQIIKSSNKPLNEYNKASNKQLNEHEHNKSSNKSLNNPEHNKSSNKSLNEHEHNKSSNKLSNNQHHNNYEHQNKTLNESSDDESSILLCSALDELSNSSEIIESTKNNKHHLYYNTPSREETDYEPIESVNKKSKIEENILTDKLKRIIHCRICGSSKHNKRTCPTKL